MIDRYEQPEYIAVPAAPGYIFLALFDAEGEPVRQPIVGWRMKPHASYGPAQPVLPLFRANAALASAIVTPMGEIFVKGEDDGAPVRFATEDEWLTYARAKAVEIRSEFEKHARKEAERQEAERERWRRLDAERAEWAALSQEERDKRIADRDAVIAKAKAEVMETERLAQEAGVATA